MKTMRSGEIGLEVSRIRIGSNPLARPPFDGAAKLVQHALELGINLIDAICGRMDSAL